MEQPFHINWTSALLVHKIFLHPQACACAQVDGAWTRFDPRSFFVVRICFSLWSTARDKPWTLASATSSAKVKGLMAFSFKLVPVSWHTTHPGHPRADPTAKKMPQGHKIKSCEIKFLGSDMFPSLVALAISSVHSMAWHHAPDEPMPDNSFQNPVAFRASSHTKPLHIYKPVHGSSQVCLLVLSMVLMERPNELRMYLFSPHLLGTSCEGCICCWRHTCSLSNLVRGRLLLARQTCLPHAELLARLTRLTRLTRWQQAVTRGMKSDEIPFLKAWKRTLRKWPPPGRPHQQVPRCASSLVQVSAHLTTRKVTRQPGLES